MIRSTFARNITNQMISLCVSSGYYLYITITLIGVGWFTPHNIGTGRFEFHSQSISLNLGSIIEKETLFCQEDFEVINGNN